MKWFHAIGVCGHATSQVAVMFKKMGWFVTGSDLQYFPPGLDLLNENNVNMANGYEYTHLTKEYWEKELNTKLDINDVPDLALVIETATLQNKELLYAKKMNVEVKPYSEILGEYLVKDESIVVIGTAGKTTTTSLITKLLKDFELDPSYMIGAPVIDFDNSLENTNSTWSVIEGDEYHSPTLSRGAKFLQYKPKYLLITKVSWEHQDIFPTEERYIEEFAKCVKIVPSNGLIIAKHGDLNIDKVLENNVNNVRVIRYKYVKSENDLIDGIYSIVKDNTNQDTEISNGNTKFKIFNPLKELVFESETILLGDYNLENILSSYILINEVPSLKDTLDKKLINDSKFLNNCITTFKGPKKRLEKLKVSSNLVIIDDFGVTPERAFNSINTLRDNFKDFEIIGIYEPNSGSRPSNLEMFNKMYKESFNNSNLIIIPELSTTNNELIDGESMVTALNSLGFNTMFSKTDTIPNLLKDKYDVNLKENKKTLFVFFSSYRLTEMAHNLTSQLA